jgi:hypothetical protein
MVAPPVMLGARVKKIRRDRAQAHIGVDHRHRRNRGRGLWLKQFFVELQRCRSGQHVERQQLTRGHQLILGRCQLGSSRVGSGDQAGRESNRDADV